MRLPEPIRRLFVRRPPLTEQAPAQGLTNALGKLSLYAAPPDPPPGGDSSYRKMGHDPQVKACLATKKLAVLSRGWEVHPVSESPADVNVADFCRWCLSNIEGADGRLGSILDAAYDVLDALSFGVSLVEINYRLVQDGEFAGMIGLRSLKAKDTRHFTFRTDEFYNIQALRIATGDELEPSKFLIYSYQPQYGNPIGVSDLRAAYRSWYLKDALLTWWAKSLEKFGMPTVEGVYSSKAGYTTAQKQDLLNIASQVHNESAIVHADDVTISLIDGKASGSAGQGGSGFDEVIAYLDRAIAKSILGQTLTSDSSAHGSTYALGAVHMDVLRFYLNKLTRDIEESVMTHQLLARLVAYNFPPGTPVPKFKLGRIDDDRLAVVGKLIADLVSGGVVAPDEPWIRGYLGLPAAGAEDA